MIHLTRFCLILFLVPSFLRHFTSHIMMLITYSKLFFLTCNLCIRLEYEFINLWSWIFLVALQMCFLMTFGMQNWLFFVLQNVMKHFITKWNQKFKIKRDEQFIYLLWNHYVLMVYYLELWWVHVLSLLVILFPNVLEFNVRVVRHNFLSLKRPLVLIW